MVYAMAWENKVKLFSVELWVTQDFQDKEEFNNKEDPHQNLANVSVPHT